jgi:hypothetical protein
VEFKAERLEPLNATCCDPGWSSSTWCHAALFECLGGNNQKRLGEEIMRNNFVWEGRSLFLGFFVLGMATVGIPIASIGEPETELARVSVGDAAEDPAWIADRQHLHVASAGGRQTVTADLELDLYTKFKWDIQIPADVQGLVDTWLRRGGTIIYPSYPRRPQEAVAVAAGPSRAAAEATAVFNRWSAGTRGRVVSIALRVTPNRRSFTASSSRKSSGMLAACIRGRAPCSRQSTRRVFSSASSRMVTRSC